MPFEMGVAAPVRRRLDYWLQITKESPVIGSCTGRHYSNQNTPVPGELDLYGCANHRKSQEDGNAGAQMGRFEGESRRSRVKCRIMVINHTTWLPIVVV